MFILRQSAAATLATLLVAAFPQPARSGDLLPPAGAPAPTMKSLDQVEPRIPISPDTTPGDADSRFRISTPGSYYLTANIFAANGKHGIEIATSGVTIDLNGFAMIGLLIPPAQARSAIVLDGDFADISILNGFIRAWPLDGINLLQCTGAHIENVNVSFSGREGIQAGSNARIINCHAERNQFSGIRATGVIQDCTSIDNMIDGYIVSGVVTNCLADGNEQQGFDVSNGTVRGCVAQGNGSDGFSIDIGSALNCTSLGNHGDGFDIEDTIVTACAARGNVGNGIRASFNCHIRDNHAITNQADGIVADGTGCHLEGNSTRSNLGVGLKVTASGCIAIRNLSSNNTSGQFSINTLSTRGPYLNYSSGGTLPTDHPTANILH